MKGRALAIVVLAGSLSVAVAAPLAEERSQEGSAVSAMTSAPASGSRSTSLHARLGVPGSFAWLEGTHFSALSFDETFSGLRFLSTAPARRLSSGGLPELTRASQLFETEQRDLISMGYSWRRVTVEGAARTDSSREPNMLPTPDDGLRTLSRLARLSYSPLRGLNLRFSRGTWSRVDQLVAEGEVRRTSLSVNYTRPLTGGEWQTTVAWGRNKHRDRQSLTGYLAETSLRFGGRHTAFGRFEQVGSDELNGVGLQQRDFVRVNKLSAGYYQDLRRDPGGQIGVGLVASRHLLNDSQTPAGTDPTSFMFFVRVKMR